MVVMTPEDVMKVPLQQDAEDVTLEQRKLYEIVRPEGSVARSRTRGEREDTRSYTGDVVQELWDGVLFREHKYFVQEEDDGSLQAWSHAQPGYKTYRYFETTVVAPDLLATMPDEIKNGRWSNPKSTNEDTQRIGAEWGKYAEDYVFITHNKIC